MVNLIAGTNKKKESEGEIIHPKAKHINAVCNQNQNLPQNFKVFCNRKKAIMKLKKR